MSGGRPRKYDDELVTVFCHHKDEPRNLGRVRRDSTLYDPHCCNDRGQMRPHFAPATQEVAKQRG